MLLLIRSLIGCTKQTISLGGTRKVWVLRKSVFQAAPSPPWAEKPPPINTAGLQSRNTAGLKKPLEHTLADQDCFCQEVQ